MGKTLMCGRFALKTKAPKISKLFQASLFEEFKSHYNIAPTAGVPIVRFDPEKKERIIRNDYWGLVPYWAKNPKIAYHTTNARAETLGEKASFKRAFKKMRCLVVMDGFFEWDRSVKPSQPYYFSMKTGEPFACAGLYESWKVRWMDDDREPKAAAKPSKPVTWPVSLGGKKYNEGDVLESCTIITTVANLLMEKVHDRMPVILDPKDYDLWLDPDIQDTGILQGLLKPYTTTKMQSWPVARLVNKVGDDDSSDCIKEVKL